MNHKHRKILHAIFSHPISANINFRDIVAVFEELGAEIDQKSGGRIGVTLNGHTAAFSHPHHDLPKAEAMKIKDYLAGCGIKPDDYPIKG